MKINHLFIFLLLFGLINTYSKCEAQQPFLYQSAAKFVCGKPGPMLAPCHYYTAINIHNPSYNDIYFRFKIASVNDGLRPGLVSEFLDIKIGSDSAVEIDCQIIQKQSGINEDFNTGFVVIQSYQRLDVVAVYTAANPGCLGKSPKKVSSIDVENIITYKLYPEKLPDLTIQKLALEPLSNTGNRDTLLLRANVMNIGDAPASPSKLLFVVKEGTVTDSKIIDTPDLDINEVME